MIPRPLRAGIALLIALVVISGGTLAQSQRDAQKRLEKARGELKSIAQERRKLEGERGDASRKLRAADEQVGRSSRTLSETESSLRREETALAELQQRREQMLKHLGGQREQLAALVRSAYTSGGDAPLKVLLSQDRAADASRTLAYHGYLQRDRAARIESLTTELQALAQVEQDIATRRAQLDADRQRLRGQVNQLQRDRQTSAKLMADLDQRYQDRSVREKALGQDVRSLERLLANLRAAAARAEAERKAAARKAAEERARAQTRQGTTRGTETGAPASGSRQRAGIEGRWPGLAAVRQPAGPLWRTDAGWTHQLGRADRCARRQHGDRGGRRDGGFLRMDDRIRPDPDRRPRQWLHEPVRAQ